MRKDAKARRLGALGDLSQHAEGVLVGLDRPVLGSGGTHTRPDDRGDDEHRENDDYDSDHDRSSSDGYLLHPFKPNAVIMASRPVDLAQDLRP
jgi:hypothetical protein